MHHPDRPPVASHRVGVRRLLWIDPVAKFHVLALSGIADGRPGGRRSHPDKAAPRWLSTLASRGRIQQYPARRNFQELVVSPPLEATTSWKLPSELPFIALGTHPAHGSGDAGDGRGRRLRDGAEVQDGGDGLDEGLTC